MPNDEITKYVSIRIDEVTLKHVSFPQGIGLWPNVRCVPSAEAKITTITTGTHVPEFNTYTFKSNYIPKVEINIKKATRGSHI